MPASAYIRLVFDFSVAVGVQNIPYLEALADRISGILAIHFLGSCLVLAEDVLPEDTCNW